MLNPIFLESVPKSIKSCLSSLFSGPFKPLKCNQSEAWDHVYLILATWEAEAGGAQIESQPELHSKTLSRKSKKTP
jgi:hypothetical protein